MQAISSPLIARTKTAELPSSPDLSDLSPDIQSNQAGARKSNLGAEVFSFPVVGKEGPTWAIRETQDAELREAFPDLDVGAEYRKALIWINANSRKTARGMMAFLFRWMGTAQNKFRGPSKPAVSAVPPWKQAERDEEHRKGSDRAQARIELAKIQAAMKGV